MTTLRTRVRGSRKRRAVKRKSEYRKALLDESHIVLDRSAPGQGLPLGAADLPLPPTAPLRPAEETRITRKSAFRDDDKPQNPCFPA
jgi:hypothetical protein